MLSYLTNFKPVVIFVFSVTALFCSSAIGQTVTIPAEISQKTVAKAEPQPSPEKKATPQPDTASDDVKTELEAVKAENAAVREMLKKMEEQQKVLLDQMDRLQKRLDAPATSDA